MPAQSVIVDLEFSSSSLDRSAGRKKSFDPHALNVITTPASPGSRTLLSRHRLPPRLSFKKVTGRSFVCAASRSPETLQSIARNCGAVMAIAESAFLDQNTVVNSEFLGQPNQLTLLFKRNAPGLWLRSWRHKSSGRGGRGSMLSAKCSSG
jgi:hypothetical protein